MKDTVRTRSCTVLFLFLSAFILSAVVRADMVAVMVTPTGDLPGISSHHPMVAEFSGNHMSATMSNCGDHLIAADDTLPVASACQTALDCTLDHCFSSNGLMGQSLAVVPCAAQEPFTEVGYNLLSIVLAPPGRPPRHV